MSKPSGGIRSLPSLSAWGLPMLAANKPPLKGEGDQRSWWRGSAEIFCSCFRFHRRNPSVKPAACQLSTRHALRVPFQGSLFCLVKFHQQNSPPPAGRTGGLSAVTLPFSLLKLGRRVSGDSPLSLLKRKKEAKKEKSSRSTCTVRFQYHPKITQETVTIDSHQQNSPGGANRRLVRRNTTLFTLEIGA